jgi:hypothetical protein
MITINSYVKAKEGLYETKLLDEVVMLDVESGHYFSLRGTAPFIWKSIQNSIKVSDLVNLLLNEYEITIDIASEELVRFLNTLESKGLVIVQ